MKGKTEKRFIIFGNKIILAVAIVLACCLFFTGCAKNSDKITYRLRGGGYCDIQEYPECFRPDNLINSLEELYVYCSMVGWRPSEPGKPWKYDSKIEKVLKNYDEEYFTKKSLIIVVYKWDNSRDVMKEVKVRGLTKESDSLIIDIDAFYYLNAIAVPWTFWCHYVYMLEVKQEDIQGIASTAIRVDKKEIKMQPEDVTFEGEFFY